MIENFFRTFYYKLKWNTLPNIWMKEYVNFGSDRSSTSKDELFAMDNVFSDFDALYKLDGMKKKNFFVQSICVLIR